MRKTQNRKKIVISNLDIVKKNKDDIIWRLSKFNVLLYCLKNLKLFKLKKEYNTKKLEISLSFEKI